MGFDQAKVDKAIAEGREIEGVAVYYSPDKFLWLYWPARHHTCIHAINQLVEGARPYIREQGFIDGAICYYTREEAAAVVKANSQSTVTPKSEIRRELYSEDVW